MVPPLLPWEVLERIIELSGDHSQTLRSFSLTCRDLLPRTLCVLVADVHFKRRVDIFDFCDFVRAKPHLKPFVRSVTVNPADFSPFPLLSILPNLPKLKFSSPRVHFLREKTIYTVLNMSSTICCKIFGTHIRALHLYNLFFPTFVDLARVLLTFPNITGLACSNVFIEAEGNQGHLDILKQRLSERLHLRTVFFECFPERLEELALQHDGASFLAGLVFNSELMRSTVETLTWQLVISDGLLRPLDWPRLQSLVLKLQFDCEDIKGATAILNEFSSSSSTLKDVMIEFRHSTHIYEFISRRRGLWKGSEELENLLRFPKLRVACLFDCAVRDDRVCFWTGELIKHFQVPALFQPGAFTVKFESVIPGAGHDRYMTDLATSPDGKWVATASKDRTICLWDAAKGTMVHQWIPHDYTDITSLAFSPDSRYLSSRGRDAKLKIWDLAQGSRQITALECHTNTVVTHCAWSPRGDMIASEDINFSVRLWEASSTSTTFHPLHEFYPPSEHRPQLLALDRNTMAFLQFSPDGSWLFFATLYNYYIWNIDSGGTLHISSPPPDPERAYDIGLPESFSAVFDPQSRRYLDLLTGLGVAKVSDIETGQQLVVLKDVARDQQFRSGSFSPDGKSVLTSSGSGTLQIWDSSTGFELCSLGGLENNFRKARFSPCGKYIASASSNNTVRLWRSRDGRCVATLKGDSLVTHVAFSGDGKTLWSGDDRGTVIMRRIVDVIPADEGDLLVE